MSTGTKHYETNCIAMVFFGIASHHWIMKIADNQIFFQERSELLVGKYTRDLGCNT
jgi:hypothetical protein